MRTRLVKWLCIASLAAAFILWRGMTDYELVSRVAVSLAAAIAAIEVCHSATNRGAIYFLLITIFSSLAILVFPLANSLGTGAILLAAAALAASLTELTPQPLVSTPSITDRNPGSGLL